MIHYTAEYIFVNILKELEMYKPELLDKPAVLCINKMDTIADDNHDVNDIRHRKSYEDWQKIPEGIMHPEKVLKLYDVFYISAKTGANVARVKQRLREIIDEIDDAKKGPHRLMLMEKNLAPPLGDDELDYQ
ncbi:unnamed protein product [Soboliphyme baturini]|uniref:OBG-type G domain-containing protein n=1 Tax=Soboliphyme baturini TaxID=241478 RepID=A0A183J926_9BILA|nr:unnamed protein product [Soboliphyme baturini]